jgi:osmotically-inducible protein OsmY
MFRKGSLIVVTLISLMLLACAGSPTSESAGQYLDSSATTAKVKASLIDELSTKGFAIKVKTYKDVVQLSGFVDDTNIKKRAGEIASGVENVQRVINDIVVK